MNILKGWLGEKKTAFRMWLFLNKRTYKRFHNIIIPSPNGTTQIDHLIVSPFGIFIIETKNKKGWIFGSENRAKWTQSIYGNNHSFQNPLKQTYRQKKILAGFLQIEGTAIQTVIYFAGDCRFKTQLPENVIRSRLSRYIKQFKKQTLTSGKVDQIVRTLEQHVSESELTKRDHIRSLRQRHQSKIICPKCGSELVERTAKKGPNAGRRFLGCENFPRCRFTKSV
jgi:hypothetical protein